MRRLSKKEKKRLERLEVEKKNLIELQKSIDMVEKQLADLKGGVYNECLPKMTISNQIVLINEKLGLLNRRIDQCKSSIKNLGG